MKLNGGRLQRHHSSLFFVNLNNLSTCALFFTAHLIAHKQTLPRTQNTTRLPSPLSVDKHGTHHALFHPWFHLHLRRPDKLTELKIRARASDRTVTACFYRRGVTLYNVSLSLSLCVFLQSMGGKMSRVKWVKWVSKQRPTWEYFSVNMLPSWENSTSE